MCLLTAFRLLVRSCSVSVDRGRRSAVKSACLGPGWAIPTPRRSSARKAQTLAERSSRLNLPEPRARGAGLSPRGRAYRNSRLEKLRLDLADRRLLEVEPNAVRGRADIIASTAQLELNHMHANANEAGTNYLDDDDVRIVWNDSHDW